MINYKILFIFSVLILGSFVIFVSAIRMSHSEFLPKNLTIHHNLRNNVDDYYKLNQSDYYFPNPVILPNNPFYWGYMIRDKFKTLTVVNDKKRIELLINLADTRLISGKILILEGDTQLGVSTILKAEKYLQKAVVLHKKMAQKDPQLDYKIIYTCSETFLAHQKEIVFLLDYVEDNYKNTLHDALLLNEEIFNTYINPLLKK